MAGHVLRVWLFLQLLLVFRSAVAQGALQEDDHAVGVYKPLDAGPQKGLGVPTTSGCSEYASTHALVARDVGLVDGDDDCLQRNLDAKTVEHALLLHQRVSRE